jgi:hypothetical protein
VSPQGDGVALRRGPLRHPGGGDRQRPAARRLQPKVELQLPGRDPLPRRRLQRLQFRLIVRRPEVLDLPNCKPKGQRGVLPAHPRS